MNIQEQSDRIVEFCRFIQVEDSDEAIDELLIICNEAFKSGFRAAKALSEE